MRISHRNLGVYVPGLREFVPARWTIPENPFLGPGMAGLGAFVPATFTLPPQPAGIGALVPATFTLPPQPAGVGDFVGTPGMYPIPPNSVSGAVAANPNIGTWPTQGMSGLGCGGDCGCGGTCGGHGMSGLGQAMTDFGNTFTALTSGNISAAGTSFMNFLEDPAIGTIPVWMIAGGGILVWALFFSGGEHSRYQRGRKATAAARRAYA
jgi:hypothetical protein